MRTYNLNYQPNWRQTLLNRVWRALAGLGFVGAVLTLFSGINGIVGVVLMLAIMDGVISFGLWSYRKIASINSAPD